MYHSNQKGSLRLMEKTKTVDTMRNSMNIVAVIIIIIIMKEMNCFNAIGVLWCHLFTTIELWSLVCNVDILTRIYNCLVCRVSIYTHTWRGLCNSRWCGQLSQCFGCTFCNCCWGLSSLFYFCNCCSRVLIRAANISPFVWTFSPELFIDCWFSFRLPFLRHNR